MFYGPYFIENFSAGNETVSIDTLFNFDASNLSGIGSVLFSGQSNRTLVEFSGLEIESRSLKSGSLVHTPDSTAMITLEMGPDNWVNSLTFNRTALNLSRSGFSDRGDIIINELENGGTLQLESIILRPNPNDPELYLTTTIEQQKTFVANDDFQWQLTDANLSANNSSYDLRLTANLKLLREMDLIPDSLFAYSLNGSINQPELFGFTLSSKQTINTDVLMSLSYDSISFDASNSASFGDRAAEFQGLVLTNLNLDFITNEEKDGILFQTINSDSELLDLIIGDDDLDFNNSLDITGTWIGYGATFDSLHFDWTNGKIFEGGIRSKALFPVFEDSVTLSASFDISGFNRPEISGYTEQDSLNGYPSTITSVIWTEEDLNSSAAKVTGTVLISHLSEEPIPYEILFDNTGIQQTLITIDGENLPFTGPFIRNVKEITESSVTIEFDELENANSYFATVVNVETNEVLTDFSKITITPPQVNFEGLPDTTQLNIELGAVLSDGSEVNAIPVSITTLKLVLSTLKSNAVQVYPNPTYGEIQIIGLSEKILSSKLVDFNGKIIFSSESDSRALESALSATLDGVKPGIYWLTMITRTEQFSFKIVKR